jgi:hypothetical protein
MRCDVFFPSWATLANGRPTARLTSSRAEPYRSGRRASILTTLLPACRTPPRERRFGLEGERWPSRLSSTPWKQSGKRHQATPNPLIAYPIRDFALLDHHSMYVGKPRCSSSFLGHVSQSSLRFGSGAGHSGADESKRERSSTTRAIVLGLVASCGRVSWRRGSFGLRIAMRTGAG